MISTSPALGLPANLLAELQPAKLLAEIHPAKWLAEIHPAQLLLEMQTANLLADMQQAQLLMVAGFVMLGWVLARRQIRFRKRANREGRAAQRAIQEIRERTEPAVPLCDAPVETQRWQVAIFDLQRELKAELDTRIVIVQSLLRQLDQRIECLEATGGGGSLRATIAGEQQRVVEAMVRSGHTAEEIASRTGLPQGDVELTIATLRPLPQSSLHSEM